jgi:hypothetical protein
MIDLATHDLDLAAAQLGEWAGVALRLVGEHRQRRLQAVGEVSDMGPGPLDQRLVVVEESVEFDRQRLDLVGEITLEPPCPPGPDRGHRPPDPPQRLEPEPDLDEDGDHEAREQDAEKQDEQTIEAAYVAGDLAPVTGHREHEQPVLEGDRAGEHPDRPALRPLVIQAQDLTGAEGRRGDGLVPERTRAVRARLSVDRHDLPVPAGQRLPETGVADTRSKTQLAAFVQIARRHQTFEQHVETLVEVPLDHLAEQGGKPEATGGEHEGAPQRRARHQPPGEGVTTHQREVR